MLRALLLVAHATAADELLARAATIDAFFQNATAPDTWTVRSHSDLTGPIAEIYDKAKRVSRAHFKGRRVVINQLIHGLIRRIISGISSRSRGRRRRGERHRPRWLSR